MFDFSFAGGGTFAARCGAHSRIVVRGLCVGKPEIFESIRAFKSWERFAKVLTSFTRSKVMQETVRVNDTVTARGKIPLPC